MNKNTFRCAFGDHEYAIAHKEEPLIKICKYCKLYGKTVINDNVTHYELDKNGNIIWRNFSNGLRRKYDGNGREIYVLYPDGSELWRTYNKNGKVKIVRKKDAKIIEEII